MDFFFLVTGYLTAKKVAESQQVIKEGKEIANHTWKFIVHKISVFYPYYICAFIVAIINVLLLHGWSIRQLIYGILCDIPNLSLTFMGIAAKSTLNIGGSWYLSAMIVGLLVLYPLLRFAAAVRLGGHADRSTLIILFIGCIVMSIILMYVTDFVVKKVKKC